MLRKLHFTMGAEKNSASLKREMKCVIFLSILYNYFIEQIIRL